jgi:hypothetical protein
LRYEGASYAKGAQLEVPESLLLEWMGRGLATWEAPVEPEVVLEPEVKKDKKKFKSTLHEVDGE